MNFVNSRLWKNCKVVDECDSTIGCGDGHDYQPPHLNNFVDALGVYGDKRGEIKIQWFDV